MRNVFGNHQVCLRTLIIARHSVTLLRQERPLTIFNPLVSQICHNLTMYLVIQELLIKLQSRVENAACHEHSIDIVQEKGIQKHVLELISFLFHPLYFLVNCQ